MSIQNITQAIAAVSAALSEIGIGKDRKNEAQGFRFRGIDDVLNVISPLYAEYGLVVVPRFTDREQIERKNAKGNPVFFTSLNGTFRLFHKDDPSVFIDAGPFPGEAMDSADKSTNKAMSAAYKYFALTTFAIPVVGTPDSDADETGDRTVQEVDVAGWTKTFEGCSDSKELRAALVKAKQVCAAAGNADAAAELTKVATARNAAILAAKKEAK